MPYYVRSEILHLIRFMEKRVCSIFFFRLSSFSQKHVFTTLRHARGSCSTFAEVYVARRVPQPHFSTLRKLWLIEFDRRNNNYFNRLSVHGFVSLVSVVITQLLSPTRQQLKRPCRSRRRATNLNFLFSLLARGEDWWPFLNTASHQFQCASPCPRASRFRPFVVSSKSSP